MCEIEELIRKIVQDELKKETANIEAIIKVILEEKTRLVVEEPNG